MSVPLLLPTFLMVFASDALGLKGGGFWLLFGVAVALFTLWFSLTVIPIVRPRRLILTEQGLTLDTLWREQHWTWDSIAGLWPHGGYKPQLELVVGSNERKRIFLGSYWPGDTAGLARVIAEYRAEA